MGTAILRHEPLALSLPLGSRRNRNYDQKANANPGSGKPNGSVGRRRKRSPIGSQSGVREDRGWNRYREQSLVAKIPEKKLVMGQVKILKRGEALGLENRSFKKAEEVESSDRDPRVKCGDDMDFVLCSTDRLGPDPEMVQKQINVSEFKAVDGIYAGSGTFFSSPPPSSVPLPAFLDWKGVATNDLRRLLRLDLV